jgi:hypothetical protein
MRASLSCIDLIDFEHVFFYVSKKKETNEKENARVFSSSRS